MTKYQVWAASFNILDKPQIIFEAATIDRAEEIVESYTKDGLAPWITYTEEDAPNDYKGV